MTRASVAAFAVPRPRNHAMLALGRLKTGQMNKLEASYAAYLELQRIAGEIVWFKFEGIKLRLADNTFLTVDFAVMRSGGLLEMHEVKGFMMEDSNVKLKVAASAFPFVFYLVRAKLKRDGGGFDLQEIT